MKRPVFALWIKSGTLLAVLLLSATLIAPWIQISEVFYNGIKVCRDGMSFGVAVQGDPDDFAPIDLTVVGTTVPAPQLQVLYENLDVPYEPIPHLTDVTHSGYFTSTWLAPLEPGIKVKLEGMGSIPLVTVEDCTLDDSPPESRILYRNDQPMLLPAVRVAYVYEDDIASRDSFVELLTTFGYQAETLTVGEAEGFDFSTVESVIVADDSGEGSTWGTNTALLNISSSGRPVIGVGEGGYAFFGQLGLAIGWPNGSAASGFQVVVPEPTPEVYLTPELLYIPGDRRLTLYHSAVDSIEIPLFTPTPAGVTRIGESSDHPGSYPLVSQHSGQGCYLLWGFRGAPDAMSFEGEMLFRNALQTPTCSLLFCRTPALAIPDDTPEGATDTLSVLDEGSLAGLKVHLRASHTWVGDLAFTLAHEGREVTLIDRPGVPTTDFGCNGNDIDAILEDGASEPVEGVCADTVPTIDGTFQPEQPLASFVGLDVAGEWTLNASDNAPADTGTLDEWCIEALVGRAATWGEAAATSTITVPDTMRVGDLNVMMYVEHAASDEVEATLTSPSGTTITLFAGVGGSNGNLGSSCSSSNDLYSYFPSGLAPDFVLDDESSFGFTDPSVTAPFTDTAVMPLGPDALADFDGEEASGEWTLALQDSTPHANRGTLRCWALDITAFEDQLLYLPLTVR